MQVQPGPSRRVEQGRGGALEPVSRAVHVPVGQRGQRAAPVLLGNDQVDAGANVVAWQVRLDQHRGDARTRRRPATWWRLRANNSAAMRASAKTSGSCAG